MPTIQNLITQIENGEVILPAIQRNFVWGENKILLLFDSIMRGYPLGIVLMWETYLDLDYRPFVKTYREGELPQFSNNEKNAKLQLVLDGQQRLQSLYLALKGTYNGKKLYFDVLSGNRTNDFREVFYKFRFFDHAIAQKQNQTQLEKVKDPENPESDTTTEASYYLPVNLLVNQAPDADIKLRHQIVSEFQLKGEMALKVELNISKLKYVINTSPDILQVSSIDKDKDRKASDRKTESDILEIFVRINRQGTVLSRSDLVFSMLKLNWKESAEDLPAFVSSINEGNNLWLDNDFVIRSLFAVSDLGAKFDVDILRNTENVDKIKANYERTCNAIRSLVDFLTQQCRISNRSLVGGYPNLIPLVYYLAHCPDHLVPNSELENVKLAVYLMGYYRPLSRYADSRIPKFIDNELEPNLKKGEYKFPIKGLIWWTWHWEGHQLFDQHVLQRNVPLTLHLLQGIGTSPVKYRKNAPEIDHIFPKSTLRENGYGEHQVNSYGNFWILAKAKNQNKSKKAPREWFAEVPDSILHSALIDRDLLDFETFKDFLDKREQAILDQIKTNLSLNSGQLDYYTYYPQS